jgi:hypothetical protein
VAEVDAALQGRLVPDERPLLAARLARTPSGVITEALALNDVVLQRLATGRMVDVESHVDGRYVNTHAGDGVVVASATGSTAYALSCGGPIVEPHLPVFVAGDDLPAHSFQPPHRRIRPLRASRFSSSTGTTGTRSWCATARCSPKSRPATA